MNNTKQNLFYIVNKMSKKYWLINDKIIFLDNDGLKKVFEIENDNYFNYNNIFKARHFTGKLKLLDSVESACLTGCTFNKKLILNNNLKKLILGNHFDQVLILNEELEILNFGYAFNKKLILNSGLKNLKLGSCFNQELILNDNLENLSVGINFSKKIILNKKLESLSLQWKFRRKLELTHKISYLGYFCEKNKIIDYLTNNVTNIKSFNRYKLKNLVSSLKIIQEYKKLIIKKVPLKVKIIKITDFTK